MATQRPRSSSRSRMNSNPSKSSMWEQTMATQQKRPSAASQKGDDDEDLIDDDRVFDDDTELDSPQPTDATISQIQPWRPITEEDQLVIIARTENDLDNILKLMEEKFQWTYCKNGDDEESKISGETRPWSFGLVAKSFSVKSKKEIFIDALVNLSESIPYWVKLKKDQIKMDTKHRFKFQSGFALRFGALKEPNEFLYSPQHDWSDRKYEQCYLVLRDTLKGRENIEWQLRNSRDNLKKQLSLSDVDRCVVISQCQNGFDIFICQKCNMSELEVGKRARARSASLPRPRSQTGGRASLGPPRPAPLRDPNQKVAPSQEQGGWQNRRVGQYMGVYFSTVQFSYRRNVSNDPIQPLLSAFVVFFLSKKFHVCYGKIKVTPGPEPYLFLRRGIPDLSKLMHYAWQVLSIVGYRLQIRLDNQFLQDLFRLREEKNNGEELFYRVCVYLARIFQLKPFVDIQQELKHAIAETKRKRDESLHGLISKIRSEDSKWIYIPAVTITPTTLRVKPLKLCRSNRVLRTPEFGEPTETFVLVDIRDETDRPLAAYHFQDLRDSIKKYLTDGFELMFPGRQYKYLHHSQSQLRERQFWFYHHDPSIGNFTFEKAYSWMGRFDRERNVVKYAARMAQCFSTTTATVEVPSNRVREIDDITSSKGLLFTDGCGTMSMSLRNEIKRSMKIRHDFSAVQFRYAGAKGVVSIDPLMDESVKLRLRPSMIKFDSDHTTFEVCKLSQARPLCLNRQAILLLRYREVPEINFLTFQQRDHLRLILNLLENSKAEKLILEKVPLWFLPSGIENAKLDYVHEPFFRHILINACVQNVRELLQRTRIHVPINQGRNMFGIADEYGVLKEGEVFVQYTLLNSENEEDVQSDRPKKTEILDNCKVVVTKNPCHHPGDVRTFIAKDYSDLRHLKDVIVFSQQGERPAPHDISGSDLDGDEYIVIWHEDLVPQATANATPYDYDTGIVQKPHEGPIERENVIEKVLEIAELSCVGQLSNIHLAYADKFGVDSKVAPRNCTLSTVDLAGKISQEVDSPKTGYHPLSLEQIKKLNQGLDQQRPDFVDSATHVSWQSSHVLGKLYRASKKMLMGWHKLLRYHSHLRHLQIRTNDPSADDEEEAQTGDTDDQSILSDQTIFGDFNLQHPDFSRHSEFARRFVFMYRQELLEILNLYGLSHESDLWSRKSTNSGGGELEDSAFMELEGLANRTRQHFFVYTSQYCEEGVCTQEMLYEELCPTCKGVQRAVATAAYVICYDEMSNIPGAAPILSLPWLFATPFLQERIRQPVVSTRISILSAAIKDNLEIIIKKRRYLYLDGTLLIINNLTTRQFLRVEVDRRLCAFLEILQPCFYRGGHINWTSVLTKFVVKNSKNPPYVSEHERLELEMKSHQIRSNNQYAHHLLSIEWNEESNQLMISYFEKIVELCFNMARQSNDESYLDISERIILLLQKLAIKETIIEGQA